MSDESGYTYYEEQKELYEAVKKMVYDLDNLQAGTEGVQSESLREAHAILNDLLKGIRL